MRTRRSIAAPPTPPRVGRGRIPRRTPRFHLLAVLTLLTVTTARAERPNIVFVYTDDQAPTAVGHLNPELRTPHIDRIAREGARLANSFVATPVCSPSRAELMTSRYGSELGILDWINPRSEPDHGLDPATVTWPELLDEAGYATGLVGKWHLGTKDRFHPTRTGFDEFTGFREGGTRPRNPRLEVSNRERNGPSEVHEGFTADVLTDHAIDFVKRHAEGSAPFLLCLHYRAPHAAWLPVREEDWQPYAKLDPTLPDPNWPGLNTEKVKRWTREYYASVASVDRNVGRLLGTLDELKLTANTVVVFTSDHGYNLGHNALWYKGNAQRQVKPLPKQRWPNIGPVQRPNLFDQSLRVPTLVRWPGVVKPGTVVERTVSNLDWYPTLLAMAGVEPAKGVTLRGRSIVPLLEGESPQWDDDLYAEYSMRHGARTDMRAWRTPKWKLMVDYANPGREELYDLANDPTEKTNLAGSTDPQVVAVREDLRKRLTAKLREIGDEVPE